MTLEYQTRRSVLVGGLSTAIVSCAPTGNQSGEGQQTFDVESAVEVLTEVGVALSIIARVAPIAGAVFPAIGLAQLAPFLIKMGTDAKTVGAVYSGVRYAIETFSTNFAASAQTRNSRPFLVPQSGNVNNFDSIPVVRDQASVDFGLLGTGGGYFGDYDIFTTLIPAEQPQPRSVDEALGSSGLPYAIIHPAPNGLWNGQHDLGVLPVGGYVSYSWKIPRGGQPTDEIVSSAAFMSPPFVSTGASNYSTDLSDLIDAGDNIVARYHIPSEVAA